MSMRSIMDCCSEITKMLPRAEVRFIPAFTLGIIFTCLILFYFYVKRKKLSTFAALKEILSQLFFLYPNANHFEFEKCDHKNCVRCNKEEELKLSIVKKWRELNKDSDPKLERVAEAVHELAKNSSKQQDCKETKPTKPIKKNVNFRQHPTILKMNIKANPWWTNYDVYLTERQLLEINLSIISEEFNKILDAFEHGKTEGWILNHIPSGHWCIYPIIDQGIVNEFNSRKCPNTAALLSNLPSVMKDCVFGNAGFSLIYPDSQIEAHYGPTNVRLRCHFGLSIPQDCYLEVNGTQYRWQSGESLIFDDSFEHAAYYAAKKNYAKPRAILLVDFWHPEITAIEKEVLQHLLAPL